jgi:hypothetical protein
VFFAGIKHTPAFGHPSEEGINLFDNLLTSAADKIIALATTDLNKKISGALWLLINRTCCGQ